MSRSNNGAIDSRNGIRSVDHAYSIGNSTGEAGGTNSTDDDKGGAIITDSYFSRNTASSEYGGAIYIDSGTGGQVTNSNFLALSRWTPGQPAGRAFNKDSRNAL